MENQTTFDLNAAVQSWRLELAKSTSFHVDDLDELESHVRDSTASLQALGLTAEEAFLIAIRRTGSRDALAAEFAAINGSSIWLDRLLWMTGGWIAMSVLLSVVVTLLVGTGLTWLRRRGPESLFRCFQIGKSGSPENEKLTAPYRSFAPSSLQFNLDL
jgi:hypothetical protein